MHLTPGRIVAPVSVSVFAWSALPEEHHPLVLAPSSSAGWFGGETLVAFDPVEVEAGLDLEATGAALEQAFAAGEEALVAALIDYAGRARVLRYDRGVLRADDGWREWGAGVGDAALGAIGAIDAGVPRVTLERGVPLLAGATTDVDGATYRAQVERVREAIAAGDVYVLNLTYGLTGPLVGDSAVSFEALADRASSAMNAFLAHGEGVVASVSPERFLSIRCGADGRRVVSVEPIKGTRPRGADAESDARSAAALARDDKERAEHVMIVDLERNDLGRVCEPGSVSVEPFGTILATPYCHQMVSRVTGTMREGATIADALAAAFPCGSVTGAPKVAAMRLIESIELASRGAYCGALVVATPGALDSSVLIRTLEVGEVPHEGGERRARWGTGCGITTDSVPSAEWLETLLKASPVTGDAAPEVALRETCRVVAGTVPLLDYHLARLAAGGCGPTVLARVRDAIASELTRDSVGDRAALTRLALTVRADGGVVAELSGLPSSLDIEGGPSIALIEVERVPEVPLGAAKPADRSVWDRAQEQARSLGADHAVLVSPDGAVIDAAAATLWIRRGRLLVTPLSPPAVAGVAREVILDRAASLGYEVIEQQLRAGDIETADEVFLSNALAGVVPVKGRGGLASRVLAGLFDQLFERASGSVAVPGS